MEEFIKSLNEKRSELIRNAANLRAEGKDDEAVFCTVRANIYEICATTCDVWSKKGKTDVCREIFARFRQEWSEALDLAGQRGDAKKICIEETKLEALEEIISRFDAQR